MIRRAPGNPEWAAALLRGGPAVPVEMRLEAAGARMVRGEPAAATEGRVAAIENAGLAVGALRAADLATARRQLAAALHAADAAIAALGDDPGDPRAGSGAVQ